MNARRQGQIQSRWLGYGQARRLVVLNRIPSNRLVRLGKYKAERIGRSVGISRTSIPDHTKRRVVGGDEADTMLTVFIRGPTDLARIACGSTWAFVIDGQTKKTASKSGGENARKGSHMRIRPHVNEEKGSPGRTAFYDDEAIPKELTQRAQWVVWRAEERGGKPTKVPYDPKTGRRAKSTDLMTWGTFSQALEALDREGYDGVGFVFCSADPFVGVDLDKCRNPETGELKPEARAIVDTFDGAYIEVSPSGTGVHIIVHGKLAEKGKRCEWIEIYSQDRYFTVTGRAL